MMNRDQIVNIIAGAMSLAGEGVAIARMGMLESNLVVKGQIAAQMVSVALSPSPGGFLLDILEKEGKKIAQKKVATQN